jgi:uncharacterized protein YdiU (UPF0061 family)
LFVFQPGYTQDGHKALDGFISHLLESTPHPGRLDEMEAPVDFKAWLMKYSSRLSEEVGAVRKRGMDGVNPRFILRQWVLEEVVAKVEKDATSRRRILAKVLKVRFHGHSVAA